MEIYSFIRPLGIITYLLIIIAVFSGLRHWKMSVHKLLAILASVFATIHALLVLLLS